MDGGTGKGGFLRAVRERRSGGSSAAFKLAAGLVVESRQARSARKGARNYCCPQGLLARYTQRATRTVWNK
jgi:hypothetical protein